jgi:hypothetical protein
MERFCLKRAVTKNIVKWGGASSKKAQIESCNALLVFDLDEITKTVSLDPDILYLIF